jgi:hypothetical protein
MLRCACRPSVASPGAPALAGEGANERAIAFRSLDEHWPALERAYDSELAAVAEGSKDVARMKRHLREQLRKQARCHAEAADVEQRARGEELWLELMRRRAELSERAAGLPVRPRSGTRAARTPPGPTPGAPAAVVSADGDGGSVVSLLSSSAEDEAQPQTGEADVPAAQVGENGVLDLISSDDEAEAATAAASPKAETEESMEEGEEEEEEEEYIDLDTRER